MTLSRKTEESEAEAEVTPITTADAEVVGRNDEAVNAYGMPPGTMDVRNTSVYIAQELNHYWSTDIQTHSQ